MMLAKITKIIQENKNVKTFVLEPEEKRDFVPGQFVMVFKEFNDRRTGRAYSIASSKDKPIKITVKLYEDGEVSSYLWKLNEGDEIKINYPFGRFNFENEENLVFISGGTGIAPIRSMILEAKKNNLDYHFLASFRTEEDLIFKEELEDLKCNVRLTSNVGRLTKKDLEFDKNSIFYICGSPEMATEIENILIEMGYPIENIKSEKW